MIHITFMVLLILVGLVLAYTWIVFPGVLLRRAHQLPQQSDNTTHHTYQPDVSIIIAAWNEETVIHERLANIEKLDYPQTAITVYIGTDGCTDRTAEVVRNFQTKTKLSVTLMEYPTNRGKAVVLVDLVKKANAEEHSPARILVFTDANTQFQSNAITKLVARLQDVNVGGVCGRLIFVHPHEQPEQTYWTLETKLKEIESHYDSCLGANGAIYAIRSACFWQQLPACTIIDDFVIGMKVRETGLQMMFEPEAIAHEDLPDTADEWKRRVRIGSGAYQALQYCRACLHPRHKYFALFFWSHKVLRWFTPHFYLLGCSLAIGTILSMPAALAHRIILPAAFLATALGCILVLGLSQWIPATPRQPASKLLAGIHHFVMMQAALFAGFIRYCRGDLSGAWQRTPRPLKKAPTA
ncbi:MAG: glycosyltransferase [Kiritimatiellia bacterium]